MAEEAANSEAGTGGIMSRFVSELVGSPLNIALLGICAFLLYKIVSSNRKSAPPPPQEPELPRMKKRDFTLEQLREYDGKGQDGRVLVSVNTKVFDVTRGKRFYGPGGPYAVFAGRDASRGLALFSLTEEAIKDEFDDLSDLTTMQMESVREWEMQFTEKYDFIGRLLRPGEEPRDYTDTEDEPSSEEKKETDKKTD
ncbi:membrane-associated progesterone receptor component 1-like [Mizuhopecten yessoensis]|uniref:Membrane-associated progesterone receptor component 2 n=1 Tax=Mizuhopecten yessoensis TaxID=6573 RepID=A0A210PT06_MIZYE|nr:membrane-associated progesterone receptor component 1-like [Mizuhopecten yessoensis]OWF39615.1 Membrane-associated progesterone receptor component 2 [Mizuhopecten yessoensis]